MSGTRDPDPIVAAWLDDGPTELPGEIRRSIAIAARTTPQSRSRLDRLAWRIEMTPFQRLGAIAAVAIMALVGLVAVSKLDDTANGGGPPASAAPSLAPSQSPSPLPALTETFTSEKYGYSIRYPAHRTVLPAAALWSPGGPQTISLTKLARDRMLLPDAQFWAASTPLPEGMTGDEWLAAYADPAPQPATWEPIMIGGSLAVVRVGNDGSGYIEAVEVVDGRVYVFTLWNYRTAPPDRALFDALVATIELHPEDALATPGS